MPTLLRSWKWELSAPRPVMAHSFCPPPPGQASPSTPRGYFSPSRSPAKRAGHAPSLPCTQVPTPRWVWAKAPAGGSEPSVRPFPTRTQNCKPKGYNKQPRPLAVDGLGVLFGACAIYVVS